jgi:hypothetical protein
MLAGYPPQHNSYTDDRHNFGHALQGIFTGRKSLLANAVRMNVWFCQMAGSRFSGLLPPPDIRNYCSSVTRTVIAAMEPRAILCVSSAAFLAIRQPAPRAKRIPEYPGSRSDCSTVFRGRQRPRLVHPPSDRESRSSGARTIHRLSLPNSMPTSRHAIWLRRARDPQASIALAEPASTLARTFLGTLTTITLGAIL